MRGFKLLTLLGCGAVLWSGPSSAVYGQAASAKDAPPPSTFSMNVKDGSVRAALTQLFESARVQYSIDQRVTGFETLHITDQGFEAALRVLLRSSSQPLSYTKENGVYFITPRIADTVHITEPPVPEATGVTQPTNSQRIDILTLTYADPYDLAPLLGIKIVPFGTRFNGMGSGGGAATGTAAGGAGASKPGGASSGTSANGSSSVINAGTLISNDSDNDILRLGD